MERHRYRSRYTKKRTCTFEQRRYLGSKSEPSDDGVSSVKKVDEKNPSLRTFSKCCHAEEEESASMQCVPASQRFHEVSSKGLHRWFLMHLVKNVCVVSCISAFKCHGRGGGVTLTLPAPTLITASLKVQLFWSFFFFFLPSTVSVDCKLFQRNHQVTHTWLLLIFVIKTDIDLIKDQIGNEMVEVENVKIPKNGLKKYFLLIRDTCLPDVYHLSSFINGLLPLCWSVSIPYTITQIQNSTCFFLDLTSTEADIIKWFKTR